LLHGNPIGYCKQELKIMAKAKSKTAAKKPPAQSVREWLVARLKKGALPVADALAYAERTGRSPVTVYRMARVAGARAKDGQFVSA
jgi:hypothetical protein